VEIVEVHLLQRPTGDFHSKDFCLDSFFPQALSSNHKQVLTEAFPSNLILPNITLAAPGRGMLTLKRWAFLFATLVVVCEFSGETLLGLSLAQDFHKHKAWAWMAEEVETLRKVLRSQPAQAVLDVACGTYRDGSLRLTGAWR
jgi:hypothetical protein